MDRASRRWLGLAVADIGTMMRMCAMPGRGIEWILRRAGQAKTCADSVTMP